MELVILCFCVLFWFLVSWLVVSTSAIDYLGRLVPEMTYYVSSAWDVKLYSITPQSSML